MHIEEPRPVDLFISRCIGKLPVAVAEEMARDAIFTTSEWLEVHRNCSESWRRCFTMQVIAVKKAIDSAKTLADWVAIAEQTKGKQRVRAFDKILEFDPTEEDIQLFCFSRSERLQGVGWYLMGKNKK